jgi:Flp pilus assembly protein TadG
MKIARKAFVRSRARFGLLAARFTTCRSGLAAVEFGFVAIPLFAVLIAIIQIAIVFLAQNELETAVEKAARSLLTGQVQQSGLKQDQFQKTVCANLPALFTCTGVMVDLQTAGSFASANTSTPTLTYDSKGKVTNSWQFQTGGSDTIMVLRVIYQFPVIPGPLSFNLANLPNGTRLLMASAVFQVEPYATLGP